MYWDTEQTVHAQCCCLVCVQIGINLSYHCATLKSYCYISVECDNQC